MASRKYKTGSNERKQPFLPLIALGIGLRDRPWAIEWVTTREYERISLNLNACAEADHRDS